MPPRLPELPKINLGANLLNPLKGVMRGSRQQIKKASSGIRSVADELRGFTATEHQTPTTTPTTAPIAPNKPSSGVSERDTLLYQLDHLVAILTQLEIHLSENCKIMDAPCDCCGKHALQARTFAMETIPIAARMDKDTLIYEDIASWAPYIEEIDTPEKVESGDYDETYRKESGTASKFRKKVQSMIAELKGANDCPGCDEMRETISSFIEKRKKEKGKG